MCPLMLAFGHGCDHAPARAGTIEALDDEYEEREFRNRTLYLRHLAREPDAIFDEEGATIDAAERLTDHDEQLADHDVT